MNLLSNLLKLIWRIAVTWPLMSWRESIHPIRHGETDPRKKLWLYSEIWKTEKLKKENVHSEWNMLWKMVKRTLSLIASNTHPITGTQIREFIHISCNCKNNCYLELVMSGVFIQHTILLIVYVTQLNISLTRYAQKNSKLEEVLIIGFVMLSMFIAQFNGSTVVSI